MIYATKTGWLIGCDVVKETRCTTTVKFWDENKERKVSKKNELVKLFPDRAQAETWINGGSK